MLIYNITIKIAPSIHTAWLQWLKTTHIPEIEHTGYFVKHQLVRLIDIDDSDGPTYALQLYVAEVEQYNHYMQVYAAGFQQSQKEQWGEKMLCFATLMAIVD